MRLSYRPFPGQLSGLLLLLPFLLLPSGVEGQVPDTIPPPPDTIPRPADSLRIRPDSLALEGVDPDSLAALDALADTILAADTLPLVQLAEFPRVLPAGFETGVWEWDRDAILGARAVTLAELVAELPGSVFLRGGDYGTPVSVSFFGAGGDRIRVFRDGLEVRPMEGSTPDLARIGLGGLQSVRVVRGVGEVRIEIESMLGEGGRPYSLVEAGTGDLNTNIFRGTYSNPRALGGAMTGALERVDTRGPKGQETGSTTGGWFRYARGIGSRGSIVLDYSARTSDREGAGYTPASASRKDWSLMSRWDLPGGMVGDLFYTSSTLGADDEEEFGFVPEARTSLGVNLGYQTGSIMGRGRILKSTGVGVPEMSAFLEGSGSLEALGGIAGEAEWEDWGGETALRTRVRGWTAPRWGFSLFAEMGSGKSGLPYLPEAYPLVPFSVKGDTVPSVVPGPRFSENESSRFGLSYRWKGVHLAGAKVRVSADSLFLLGLPSDRNGATVEDVFLPSSTLPGGTRNGFEVSGQIPLYPSGFSLVGSYQWWDQAEDVMTVPQDSLEVPVPLTRDEMPWRYLPRRNYQAAISFHDSFYPTGNLEVWLDLGVKGRDPMAVPFVERLDPGEDPPAGEGTPTAAATLLPTMVPFAQSWYVRLQIRVVTVRVFFMWENLAGREGNQDFPGRLQPASRSLYGVRWTMWN